MEKELGKVTEKIEEKSISKDNKRNIGLDCLKIVSMVMILILHYLGKGGLLGQTNNSTCYYIVYYFLEALSIIAVNCYVLISGYFLIHSKFKWKKVLKLWGEALFYSIVVYALIIVVGLKEFQVKDMIISVFPILTKQYWFVNVYLMMYILSPFINKLIHHLTQKEYKNLLAIIIVGFSVMSILPSVYTLDSTGGYSIIWFIALYLIAGYLRIYGLPKKILNRNYLVVYVMVAFAITVAMLLVDYINAYIGKNIILASQFLQYNNILVLIESIALFMYFKNWVPKHQATVRIISFVAPLTLAVYLIHEQSQLRSVFYDKVLHTSICYHNPYSIFIVMGSVVTIFAICILIEWLRKLVVNKLFVKPMELEEKTSV